MFCNPAVYRAKKILSIVCLSLAPESFALQRWEEHNREGGREIYPSVPPPSLQSSALPTEIGWPYLRIGCIMCQLFTWFLTPGINHITL